MSFKNRILEYGVKPADQFLAHPKNARMHPQFQREAMKAALDTVGFVAPVLEAASGYLVDGHERIWQALQNNNADVPFVRLDISEEEEAYVLATFDPLTALANYDAELLDGLLQEVNSDSPAIQKMLADLATDNGLYMDTPTADDPGAQIDRAEELLAKWPVARGDLWVIGEHRLLCGDSTNTDDVARLMGGEKADAVVTDPPYGMNLNTEWGDRVGTWDRNVKSYSPVENDDKPFDRSSILIQAKEEFWFGGDYYVDTLPNFGKDGSWLVWDKRQEGSLDDMRGNAFELCWSKQRHRRELMRIAWVGVLGHNKTDDGASKFHPTQKPVKLLKWIIETFTDSNSTVADPFLGSGTTLVACEQTGRKGRGLEIEPKYCAVILERMSGMGITPRLSE
jgi:DNA modification methylase